LPSQICEDFGFNEVYFTRQATLATQFVLSKNFFPMPDDFDLLKRYFGLSLSDIARWLNIGLSTLSMSKTGERNFPPKVLSKFTNLLLAMYEAKNKLPDFPDSTLPLLNAALAPEQRAKLRAALQADLDDIALQKSLAARALSAKKEKLKLAAEQLYMLNALAEMSRPDLQLPTFAMQKELALAQLAAQDAREILKLELELELLNLQSSVIESQLRDLS
jgi:hypothetical protein